MSTTGLTYRPSSGCNWADDDDDDFDLEAWKATADTSAPDPSEFGPLQSAYAQDKEVPAFTSTNSPPPGIDIAATARIVTSGALSVSRDPAIIAEEVHFAAMTLVGYAFEEIPDPPAYPELSFHEGRIPSPRKRVKYSSNWKKSKADAGVDCRETALYQLTPLRRATSMSGRQIVVLRRDDRVNVVTKASPTAVEAPEELHQVEFVDDASSESSSTVDTWEQSDSDSESSDKENVPPTIESPTHLISFNSIADGAENETLDEHRELEIADVVTCEQVEATHDEGYSSATPQVSPTEETFGDKVEVASNDMSLPVLPAVAYTRRDSAARQDALDAFVVFRDEVSNGNAYIDVFEEDHCADTPPEITYPDIEHQGFSSSALISALHDDDEVSPSQKAYDAYLAQTETATTLGQDDISEVSPSQKAYDAYLAQSEEPASLTAGTEIVIVKDGPLEAGDLFTTSTQSTSPSSIAPESDASSPRADFGKPASILKRITLAALAKGRQYFAFFPGVGMIMRNVCDILGRARGFLHHC